MNRYNNDEILDVQLAHVTIPSEAYATELEVETSLTEVFRICQVKCTAQNAQYQLNDADRDQIFISLLHYLGCEGTSPNASYKGIFTWTFHQQPVIALAPVVSVKADVLVRCLQPSPRQFCRARAKLYFNWLKRSGAVPRWGTLHGCPMIYCYYGFDFVDALAYQITLNEQERELINKLKSAAILNSEKKIGVDDLKVLEPEYRGGKPSSSRRGGRDRGHSDPYAYSS